jgi:5'(3')-deoxyribonucleotidase
VKRIAIDLDNTIADYMAVAVPILRERYGLGPSYDRKINKIEEIFGLTPATRPAGMQEKIYIKGHLFRRLPPLEKDINKLSWCLKDMGFKIYVITARDKHPVIVEDSLFWLQENNFYFDDVFFIQDKAQLCELLDIPIIIEDELGQAISCLRKGIDVILRNQPWNVDFILDKSRHLKEKQGRLFRIDSWREVLSITEEEVP